MKKKQLISVGLILLFSLVFLVGGAVADDVKTRMKRRLPDIVKLKSQGLVGENARGYLAHVTAKKTGYNIIAAENKDRKAVYRLIAGQQGVTLEKVETLRALQIVKKAKPGDFLQKPDGSWYRK
ncbi:hypothetical protein SAMN02746065_102186 [Desulfocicer vacuolatum DSM 3385]|uniref:DUF1318 domain-containing protein n=1 Tax=Desulfocicer vacuolatum DSM 3385 TaxID=1121400 RepID=A0A1W1ZC86_9BACT|nr:YdbL family protein [Desulfocicer vacuolatum]SMC46025.1 hypothetical protein SAMN02746065_102186 [Desulfocicer vacuolatum DSM 3385]